MADKEKKVNEQNGDVLSASLITHSQSSEDIIICDVPFNVLIRPIPPVLDEDKVKSLMNTIQCAMSQLQKKSSQEVQTHPSTSNDEQSGHETEKVSDDNNSRLGKWCKEMVLLLISEYKDNEEKFKDINWTRKQIWNHIAKNMKKNGYDVTGVQCDTKWRNLKKQFKKLKEKQSRTGRGKITWEFYSAMETAIGERPDVVPVDVVETSLGMNENDEDMHESLLGDTSRSSSLSPSPSTSSDSGAVGIFHSKGSKRPPSWYEDYREIKRKQMELREKRHAENMEHKRRKEEETNAYRSKLLALLEQLVDKE